MYRKYRIVENIASSVSQYESYRDQVYRYTPTKGAIKNIPALVQIMAWLRIGDKPLSEQMLTLFTNAYMRHLASMS